MEYAFSILHASGNSSMASCVLLPLCCHGAHSVHSLSFPWELCSLVSPAGQCNSCAVFWCWNFWSERLWKVLVLSPWLTSSCVDRRLSCIVDSKYTWEHGAFVIYIKQVLLFIYPRVFLSLPLLLQVGQLDELILEPRYIRLFFKKRI